MPQMLIDTRDLLLFLPLPNHYSNGSILSANWGDTANLIASTDAA